MGFSTILPQDHDLILALVMDANGSLDAMEEDLKLLAARTAAFLRKVRELLDTLSNQYVSEHSLTNNYR